MVVEERSACRGCPFPCPKISLRRGEAAHDVALEMSCRTSPQLRFSEPVKLMRLRQVSIRTFFASSSVAAGRSPDRRRLRWADIAGAPTAEEMHSTAGKHESAETGHQLQL
ncbi:unnamed protein product [Durusdinium trenchii]|uniref:Uncharacterized protein n=1 Tax=Durusdinium trenchii TaxID=1381693 RepID=A0ABP0HFY2_9DINO